MNTINKENLYKALINGAIEVMENRLHLNKINVFPVADGDTGSNLYSMMNSIVINTEVKASIRETLESIADSAIIGARGNSGLIFAQYLYGISQVTGDLTDISDKEFVLAAQRGFTKAYGAVEEPVEGTILTTMRIFYETLAYEIHGELSLHELLERAYNNVEEAVTKTTDQLVSLKKASVVDSGAKGFAFFIKGFIDGLKGNTRESIDIKTLKFEDFDLEHDTHQDAIPGNRYCTEALIEGDDIKLSNLKERLTIYGDSLVVAGNHQKARIHIHTNTPSRLFDDLSREHNILSQKVDDMLRQYQWLHQRKYKRVIVSDSIADIPTSILDEYQVVTIHLDLLLGIESYIDKLTIKNNMLFKRAKERQVHPTSSQPSLSKIEKLYEDLLNHYDEIIVITVSKKLSGSYNVINTAAKLFDNKIKVIDSKQNSVAQGLLLYQLIDKVDSNLMTERIIREIEKESNKTKILVAINTLDNMVASGRLPSLIGKIGRFIGLKPIITLKNGYGVIDEIAFTNRQATAKIIKQLKKINEDIGIKRYALTYVVDEISAIALSKEIESALGFPCDYLVESSSIIAAGAGEGALAVAYITK